MSAVKNSSDIKAEDIYRCMEGEYAFYIEDEFERANEILLEAIKLNENKSYPKRSLLGIYKKNGNQEAFEELNSEDFSEDEID